jgi:FKBP-type peptidyl-prolyl cis-trans isomerase FklB
MKLKIMSIMVLTLLALQVQADVDVTPTTPTALQTGVDQAKLSGQAFLDKNKKNPGVVTLPDGLQYKILVPGKGPTPSDQDIVTVEYVGKLVDGTEFDNSAKHGGTVDFPVGQVIPGWVEALKLMQAGSSWEIYIPSELGYGEQGAPPVIGPNETLIFKVKLVSFKKSIV